MRLPIHGYLTDRELSRANVAYFWRTTPDALRRIPKREFRVMAEAMDRILTAREQAIEAAKYGRRPPSARGRPGPNDEIRAPGRHEQW